MTEVKKTTTAKKTVAKAAPKAAKTVAKVADVKLNNATYATGKRKDSVARVDLVPGKGNIFVNDIPVNEYSSPVSSSVIVIKFRLMFSKRVLFEEIVWGIN